MRSLSKEEIDQIEAFGAAYLLPEAVAAILQIPASEVKQELRDEGSLLYAAYWKGYYTTTFEIQQTVVAMAKAASTPAIDQAKKLRQAIDLSYQR